MMENTHFGNEIKICYIVNPISPTKLDLMYISYTVLQYCTVNISEQLELVNRFTSHYTHGTLGMANTTTRAVVVSSITRTIVT